MQPFKTFIIDEKAPPSAKAEKFIKDNKAKFKKEYGEDWEEVLYATAWKMFGKKEGLDEKTFYDKIVDYANRKIFNSRTYQAAFTELERKIKMIGPKRLKNNLLGFASDVARKYDDVDYRELAAMYVDAYPQYADEIVSSDKSEFDYQSGQYV